MESWRKSSNPASSDTDHVRIVRLFDRDNNLMTQSIIRNGEIEYRAFSNSKYMTPRSSDIKIKGSQKSAKAYSENCLRKQKLQNDLIKCYPKKGIKLNPRNGNVQSDSKESGRSCYCIW